jgi:hypothetical protein
MGGTPEIQDERRKEIIGGTVSAREKARIDEAREFAGIKTMSEFIRVIMLERAEHILTKKRRGDPAPQESVA